MNQPSPATTPEDENPGNKRIEKETPPVQTNYSPLRHHKAAITRLRALAGDDPQRMWAVEPFIAYHQGMLSAAQAVEDALNTIPPRSYGPVGNEHRTRTNIRPQSSPQHYPGGYDIRIDPPYDR